MKCEICLCVLNDCSMNWLTQLLYLLYLNFTVEHFVCGRLQETLHTRAGILHGHGETRQGLQVQRRPLSVGL
jgi:hypothetical protein